MAYISPAISPLAYLRMPFIEIGDTSSAHLSFSLSDGPTSRNSLRILRHLFRSQLVSPPHPFPSIRAPPNRIVGPYSCAGKPMALLEMRMILCRIVMNFDMAFADGEDTVNFCNDQKDHFTMQLPPLGLVFTPRQ